MYETIRIVNKLKPKYVLWENVKNLLSKKHIHNFKNYISIMNELGYNSYYQVLNSKNYGIPQNRERVFTLSIRQDIDNGLFTFPKPMELKLKLKDMLEDNVDEKYFLSEKMIKFFYDNEQNRGGNTLKIKNNTKQGYLEAQERRWNLYKYNYQKRNGAKTNDTSINKFSR